MNGCVSVMIIGLAVFSTGCASDWKPAVSLGMSPRTIKARVKIEPFIDQSPKTTRKVIATNGATLVGELAADVD